MTYFRRLKNSLIKNGNPGNNILDEITALDDIFSQLVFQGAMTSILGPNYIMHPHRHCHYNTPNSRGQGTHQDNYEDDENVRHHRTRWTMAFCYPQDADEEMGPTAIISKSYYYLTHEAAHTENEIALSGEAGTITILHYDI